ncbi:hypothetical protein ACSMCT_23035, partial [Salmonella enterica]
MGVWGGGLGVVVGFGVGVGVVFLLGVFFVVGGGGGLCGWWGVLCLVLGCFVWIFFLFCVFVVWVGGVFFVLVWGVFFYWGGCGWFFCQFFLFCLGMFR